LRNLNYKLNQLYLTGKIFLYLTPAKLYHRVFVNLFKNILRAYSPSSAVLGLTYDCQCKCVHCSAGLYKKNKESELTTGEWFGLIDEIYKLGIPRINLSGGEALLRDDIFEIIKYASDKVVVILESNGQMITEKNALSLKKSGVSCVAISVDSDNASTHDSLRSVFGCFDRAMQGIDNLHKSGVPCLISTYMTKERLNDNSIEGIMNLAKKKRVLAVRIMPARPSGSFSCHNASLLDRDAEIRLSRMIDPAMAYFKGIPAPSRCGVFCKATFYISPYGEVQPCPYLPLSFGTIISGSLTQILDKMWKHDIFKRYAQDCLILNDSFRQKIIKPHLTDTDIKGIFPIAIK
jgi:MoaA/NifB/PqqE/SkfB family radical SAM enzyme